ncbi:hypothetical protein Ava_B0126 (plasmid) [Trichormus variabilis ATCC 29413]|uniref:Uncharacterized protein n=2 Tax=Anabaena variabilis TaxID=264691 RepID=Q3M2E8_TRIV2|nr:hypothetical protein [Trichormus variabilis]MBC1218058.1 hypothetical protein [Trichormus variabilis ARAD]MBC1259237.1 hypothetical protein [Trichormus variabilis V5]MBC1270841.1 hypothetical protein [Trichormus variabilis FSR]MBC1305744.1 hypothetical protein [Trichormus variabilis N2B]MBC1314744.1 hypothetical protein [Trichormus variabilis PNB]MBC1330017.1 hypothetical protein [Trichormus variabilis 9RC]
MESTISIPQGWQCPWFTFGQRTQQGPIIGLKYYPAGTFLASEYGEGWRYILMPDKRYEDEEHRVEDEVKLLTPEELQTQIQAEIDHHSRQLELLKFELKTIPVTVVTAESEEQEEAPIQQQQKSWDSPPTLQSFIDAAQLILREISKHPDFVTLEYQPDLTITDAQAALSYLQSGLEEKEKFDITANIFPEG